MKKILSVLLTLAMTLTVLAIPFSVGAVEDATEQTKVLYKVAELDTDGDGFVELPDGISYEIIYDVATFENKIKVNNLTTEHYYILADDIDFSEREAGSELTEFSAYFCGVLEGNGCSLLNYSQTGSQGHGGLFNGNTNFNITVRNLTFGTKENPIQKTAANTKGTGVLSGRVASGGSLTCENVTVYVEYDSNEYSAVGGFVGYNAGTASFSNCRLYASFKNNSGGGEQKSNNVSYYGLGGFIGHNTGTLTFTNCEADAVIATSGVNAAAFIGYQGSGTASFTNCNANANIATTGISTGGAGGFIGHLYNGSATLDKCAVDGSITAYNFAGGLVGRKNKTLTVTDCVCYADVSATNKYAGGLTGSCTTGSYLTVNNFLHMGELSVGASDVGGMTGLAGGTITANNVFTTYTGGVDASYVQTVTEAQLKDGLTFYADPSDETSKLITLRMVGEKAYFGNTIECENKLATVYAQCTALDDNNVRNHRILVAVDATYLDKITSVAFRVTYTLTEAAAEDFGSNTWTAELAGNEVSAYTVVMAAGSYYATEAGTVLLAVVIEGVPDADWTEMKVELITECSAVVDDGTYNVTADYTVERLTAAN